MAVRDRQAAEAAGLGVELEPHQDAEEIGADQQPPGAFQLANTTSASAIQPRPAVMRSAHIGVITSEK